VKCYWIDNSFRAWRRRRDRDILCHQPQTDLTSFTTLTVCVCHLAGYYMSCLRIYIHTCRLQHAALVWVGTGGPSLGGALYICMEDATPPLWREPPQILGGWGGSHLTLTGSRTSGTGSHTFKGGDQVLYKSPLDQAFYGSEAQPEPKLTRTGGRDSPPGSWEPL
jgi:hypothetical protein